MRNFDTELDRAGVTEQIQVRTSVEVSTPANERHTYLLRADKDWGWEELRDYVVDRIEQRHGRFPRSAVKEKAIFARFVGEWGERSAAIARYAFETLDGYWEGAPISVNRFCKGSDGFFARPIIERLDEVAHT